MAKDPAFLFYPNDWLGGTMYMTRHQKGCYIDLLIAQFNNGPLSLEQVRTILGQDQANWTVLQAKFEKDANGMFFNKRLATEVEKRKKFSESRKNNINKRYEKNKKSTSVDTYVDTSVLHMENRNRNTEDKGGMGEKEESSALIIPQMLSAWLEVFPNYAGYQINDFPALKEILDFIIEQKDVGHDIENSENIEKAKSKMRTIAMNVKADKFYNGKSLDTIRKKVQEFYTSKQISESKSIKNSFEMEAEKILEREKLKRERIK